MKAQKQFKITSLCGLSCVLLAAAAIVISGCGKGGSAKLYPVKGTLTDGGKPLANADIVFTPKDVKETVAPSSFGTTDASGNFELKTANDGIGAVAGEHTVSVTVGGVGSEPKEGADGGEEKPSTGAIQEPKEYGLTATVSADGENDLKLDVSKQ